MMNKKAFVWLLCCGFYVMTVVFVRIEARRKGSELSNRTDAVKLMAARNEHAKLTLYELKSPAQIQEAAQRRLGMTMPDPDMVVSLSDQLPQQTDRKWIARLFDGDIRNN